MTGILTENGAPAARLGSLADHNLGVEVILLQLSHGAGVDEVLTVGRELDAPDAIELVHRLGGEDFALAGGLCCRRCAHRRAEHKRSGRRKGHKG